MNEEKNQDEYGFDAPADYVRPPVTRKRVKQVVDIDEEDTRTELQKKADAIDDDIEEKKVYNSFGQAYKVKQTPEQAEKIIQEFDERERQRRLEEECNPKPRVFAYHKPVERKKKRQKEQKGDLFL